MPSVRLSWAPAALLKDGPWIYINISAPEFEISEGRPLGLEFPQLTIKALIDTGASVTVVNPEVARTCKLRQTGVAQIVAAGSSGTYAEHAAGISFPGTDLRRADPIRVIACSIVRQPVSCLIGRDILQAWRFTYDGPAAQVEISQ